MKTLVVYYSYQGNTKSIVDMINKKIDADIVRIDTVVPYKGSYSAVVDQGQDEVNRGFCPEITPSDIDISAYNTVIIGTPVWWYTFAPAMHTFLKSQNWQGKTVYPFATNGGWIGHTFKDIKEICKGADVKDGLNINFNGTTLRTPSNEIDKWIDRIK